MIIGKMSIVQNFHGYSDTVVVVVAVGEVDGVADLSKADLITSQTIIKPWSIITKVSLTNLQDRLY